MTAILLAAQFYVLSATAQQKIDLKTPRGSTIQVDVYNPGQPRVLLMAPGKACAPRPDLYGALAKEGLSNHFTLVRLYWAYCVSDPQHGSPSGDLSTEKEDFLTALNYVKGNLGLLDLQIFVGGKSLGTFVSSDVFKDMSALPGLVLLTPVCTESTDTAPPRNSFAENYPSLATESRPVLFVQGNQDPICNSTHFQEYMNGKPSNFVSLTTNGDHGLGIKDSSGNYISQLGNKNLRSISKWIFSWLN